MASKYKILRCPGCDGTLEYNKEKKVWVCIYCGNEIRREEEYDGLYTIKNVARQVLVDLAYNDMESAQKNLIECKKISSEYVGTVIIEICYNVFRIISRTEQVDQKNVFGQIQRLYEQLQKIDPGISAEEEALYESFKDSQDAFGVLLLVFDTLGAKEHKDFVTHFFDGAHVYSISLNANLLNYALRNNEKELSDKIFSNTDNINCRDACFILLKSYDDSETKRNYVENIISKAEFDTEDYKKFGEYLKDTKDGTETKILVYEQTAKYKIAPPITAVLKGIYKVEVLTEDQLRRIITSFTMTQPKDSELYEYLEDIYLKHSGSMAEKEISYLMESGIFIKTPEKVIKEMMNRRDWSVEERCAMYDKTRQCNKDEKVYEGVFLEVLLRNQEDQSIREQLIFKMLEEIKTIPTNALMDYIVRNSLDGDNKPKILEKIMELDLNKSFFREALNQYIRQTTDSSEVQKQVGQILNQQGIKVDSSILVDMAVKANEENYMDVVAFILESVKNGTRLDNEAVSFYLEMVKPKNYRAELIDALHTSTSKISTRALAFYVLYSVDTGSVKVKKSIEFAEQSGGGFGSSTCMILFMGHKIECNLFQAYTLMAPDSENTMQALCTTMKNEGARLNPDMVVDLQEKRFKKFVLENKGGLKGETLNILEQNKVFSLFF